MRKVVCAIALGDQGMILVKKKDVWILPGGKPENGESDELCLRREIGEELPGLKVDVITYFNRFCGLAPHKGDEIFTEVYLISVSGHINPAAEISDSVWTKEPESFNLSDVTKKIVRKLRQNGQL